MGQVVDSILTHGGPPTALVFAFGLLNLATLWLALRWAERKQRRLVRAFARHSAKLIETFTDTQERHDERLGAVEVQVGELVKVVRERPRSSWAAIPDQRGASS